MPPRKRARDAELSSAAKRARLTIPCGDVAFRWAELTKMWHEGSFLDCVVVVFGVLVPRRRGFLRVGGVL